MAEPRPSTDEENAPLLAHPEEEHNSNSNANANSRVLGVYDPSRPLTRLERVLAVVAILLLLIAGVFIGLFAETEHQLKKERKEHAPKPPHFPDHPEVCTSTDCVVAAAAIVKSMNSTADPCEDFYEFAVGGWLDTATIPADRGLIGSFNEVSDNNKRILIKVIEGIPQEEPLAADAEKLNLRKLRNVYDSCMDIDRLNKVGNEPIVPLVKHVVDTFGKFDVSTLPDSLMEETAEWRGAYHEDYTVPDELLAAAENFELLRKSKGRQYGALPSAPIASKSLDIASTNTTKERRDRITKTLAWLHARGIDTLFNFVIEGDAGGEDSQIQSLWLYQSFGGLPSKEYYEEAPIVDLYHSVISGILTDLAKTTGSKSKRGLPEELISLADSMLTEDSDGWPWPWPGDDDKEPKKPKKPDVPLDKRMDKLAGEVVELERKIIRAGADPEYLFNPHFAYNPYSAAEVDAALPFLDLNAYLSAFAPRLFPENITVTHPPYLKSISKIVANTPDHVLSAYFITKLALAYSPALGPDVEVRKEKRRLEEVLQGIKKGTEENRQDVCLRWVDNLVGFIAGREFVREAFSPEAKADGEGIINSVVSAFHKKLPHIKWMDAESAAAAQKKAKAIIPKVGYPLYPDTMVPESINAWYARLTINKDDFFGNVLRSELLEGQRTWGTLGRKRNRNSWEMYPQTVNAYYSPPDGEIVFPAGILQPPFYSLSWPAYLRYGAFGAVAAHELTHAFDNSGAQYDEKGRLRDWWTNSTVKAFQERAQCVARQYSKYYVLDAEGRKVYVNGNLTNGEDIADSGLAQAYAAWKDSEANPTELPGLPYTPDQLFFLAFARVWAQLTRPATAVSRVRTDPHSPPYWRAVGTLRNLPAFHEAFGCKLGSGMNPNKQCELW